MLTDSFDGRRLTPPNDVTVARDGAIWFTDPIFGISKPQEGYPATPELDHTSVYRLDPSGRVKRMAGCGPAPTVPCTSTAPMRRTSRRSLCPARSPMWPSTPTAGCCSSRATNCGAFAWDDPGLGPDLSTDS